MISCVRGLADSSLRKFMCEDKGVRYICVLTGFRLPDLGTGGLVLDLSPGREVLAIAGDLSG